MCDSGARRASASEFFDDPRVKCCSYVPVLASFQDPEPQLEAPM